MKVIGIGNVTQCNKAFIFLSNEGKQERIRANKELLNLIRETAVDAYMFYGRMWEEITTEYEKRKAEVEKKYQFITDEMVEEAFKRGRKDGLELSWKKDTFNTECIRQYGKLHGFYEGANLAGEKRWEAQRLQVQAEQALKEL